MHSEGVAVWGRTTVNGDMTNLEFNFIYFNCTENVLTDHGGVFSLLVRRRVYYEFNDYENNFGVMTLRTEVYTF